LKDCPEAIETIYPQTQVQFCLVHPMRFSLAYVSVKDRKAVASDLKVIYRAATAEEVAPHLVAFAEKWNGRYPSIAKSWRANWAGVIPIFGFPANIRRAVYTTNATGSLKMSLRKVIKTRASFPNDEAAVQVVIFSLA